MYFARLATYAKKFSGGVSPIINHVARINYKDKRTTKRTMEKNCYNVMMAKRTYLRAQH